MSGRISETQKDELKNAGLWDEFLTLRDDLRDDGLPPSQATEQALSRLLPTEHHGSGNCSLAPAPNAAFGDRRASEAEVVRWVARNMEVADVAPENAPDPTAWGLLLHCRSSPAAKADFWRITYPKMLPSRAQLEREREDEEPDGQEIIKIMQRVRESAEKAKRETLMRDQAIREEVKQALREEMLAPE